MCVYITTVFATGFLMVPVLGDQSSPFGSFRWEWDSVTSLLKTPRGSNCPSNKVQLIYMVFRS